MNYSVIQKSQLEGAHRLDAEYYQLEYFIDFSKGRWLPIRECLETCQYGLSLAMNDQEKGVPMFKMDDIDYTFLFDDTVRFAEASKKEAEEFLLHKDDVLFNRVNSIDFVGRTGIYKLNNQSVFASYLIRLQPKKDAILPDYLNMFLNSSFGRRQINKYARRAVNQANVNAQELQDMKIAVLPMAAQKEIASLSNEAWNCFENAKLHYKEAEQVLLQELGVDDKIEDGEISTVVNFFDIQNAHRIDAEFFQPKYENIVQKSKKYHSVKLGDLVTVTKGIEPGSDAYQDQGKLFVRVSNMSKFGLTDNNQKYVTEKLFEEFKSAQPQKGEILLTKDATPGIAYVVKNSVDGVISGGIVRLKLKSKDVDSEYLALCLNSQIGQMQIDRASGGSIIKHWKPSEIKETMIPILPIKTQEKIAGLVRQSFEAREKAKQLLEEAKHKVEEMIENTSNQRMKRV
ncbi:MAG: restriction endonuclease subunit S [Candidatus Kerfeldbacteria bacterium]|nr:restriction endonuclease subunit S [Candidatus Kerfeldbacteria bacterium]